MIIADDIIAAILLREDVTFTDRPDDKGGPTCCGITLATYAAYRAPLATTVEDLKLVTPQVARQMYQHVFIDAPGYSQILDKQLQALVVDAGVQHGTPESTKMLQRAAGVTPDGHLGPVSLTVINSQRSRDLYFLMCGARIRLYGSIVAHDAELTRAKLQGFHLQADNALGWANRIAQFVEVLQ